MVCLKPALQGGPPDSSWFPYSGLSASVSQQSTVIPSVGRSVGIALRIARTPASVKIPVSVGTQPDTHLASRVPARGRCWATGRGSRVGDTAQKEMQFASGHLPSGREEAGFRQ